MSQNLRAGPSCVSRQENVVDGQKLSRGQENRPEMLKASLTHIAGVAADQIFQEVAISSLQAILAPGFRLQNFYLQNSLIT